MDRMINNKLDHYDRDTEIAITMARSDMARDDAEKIVNLVRAFRAAHKGNGHVATIRACIMIGKILRAYGARAEAKDKNFVRTCMDVLDPPHSNGNGSVRKKVARLAARFAG